ncbi:phage shock protein C (PspC) family protein [Tamaricihabitans halophyticus]|uniref:Phage shock protein C (PspC) family protein n=1 Tax=Tamaricihabitans halophyticus TaxID=1262583 RepID=A0A4R2QKM7_9PSEU|nr:PspC domain-containing protein [Tamaricihabitans halophyticus]TCP49409.1 phage shock protein C (PspC) family protein [Tamaricihabitans halophyticus]
MSKTRESSNPPGFEATVRDFWVSRPRRPHQGRKIAGVAEGIGRRYGIDPVIVRVALAVGAFFGGSGALVYLLGWLLLPDERDEASAVEALFGKGTSSTGHGFTVLLLLGLFPVGGWAFSSGAVLNGFVGLALAAAALFLLHRSRGQLRRPAVTTYQEASMSSATAGPAMGGPTMGGGGSPAHSAGQEWDPLGADPRGWDMPAPVPVPVEPDPEPPRRKSRIGVATLGATLLAGGSGVVLHQLGVGWFTPAHIIGIMLGVLGIGMVASAFAGAGRGLIWLAIPLSAAGLVLSSIPLDAFRGGMGDLNERPTTLGQVQDSYERSIGSMLVDFSGLPDSGNVRSNLSVGTGALNVVVPEDATVNVTCSSGAGSMSCLGEGYQGLGAERTVTDNGSSDLTIDLDVEVGMGDLVVRRG